LHPVIVEADHLAIPVIVLGEYRYGIGQSRHRARCECWLREFLGNCRLLVIDEATTRYYAQIRTELRTSDRPIPGNDVWIAALSRQHSLPLVSRDVHFDFVADLRRLQW
jgi:tRNA(fMet)-specific endonuclease VapC